MSTTMPLPDPTPPPAPPLTPSAMPKPSDYVYVRALRPKSRHFVLESHRLESSNAFFRRNMSSREWHAQTREPRVLLVDADELLISFFVTFIRKNVIDLSLVDDEDPYMILFNAYHLAVFWNDDNFQNATTDAIATCALNKIPWSVMLPKMVWEVEPAESKLRELVLDIYVWLGGKEWLGPKVSEGLTGDFIVDLIKRFMDWEDKKKWEGTPPFIERLCEYHIHEEGMGCEHMKQHDANNGHHRASENETMSNTEATAGSAKTSEQENFDVSQAAADSAPVSDMDRSLEDKEDNLIKDVACEAQVGTIIQAESANEAGWPPSPTAQQDNIDADSTLGSQYDAGNTILHDDRERSETVTATTRLNTPIMAPESGDGDVFSDALVHEETGQDNERSIQAADSNISTTVSDLTGASRPFAGDRPNIYQHSHKVMRHGASDQGRSFE